MRGGDWITPPERTSLLQDWVKDILPGERILFLNINSWASSRVSRGSESGKVLSLQKIYEGFKRTFLENLEVLKTLQGGIFQEKYKVYQDFNIFLSNWKGLFLLEKFSEG